MQARARRRRDGGGRRRRGVILLESALIYSVTLMLVLGTIVMGLGVFQYQQIAFLAREGARWAAVHGATYSSEQVAAAITYTDVLNKAILPRVVILNTSSLSCTMSPSTLPTSGVVTVTVTYKWTPEAYWSPITMTSTATAPILY